MSDPFHNPFFVDDITKELIDFIFKVRNLVDGFSQSNIVGDVRFSVIEHLVDGEYQLVIRKECRTYNPYWGRKTWGTPVVMGPPLVVLRDVLDMLELKEVEENN